MAFRDVIYIAYVDNYGILNNITTPRHDMFTCDDATTWYAQFPDIHSRMYVMRINWSLIYIMPTLYIYILYESTWYQS